MGKRSPGFKRRKHDKYDTPYEAVPALIPHLAPVSSFCEPCAGKGLLIDHLQDMDIRCISAFDIKPRRDDIKKLNALKDFKKWQIHGADYIITNPPWTRQLLHPMIDIFRNITTTWLLFDADWMHTKQAKPYLEYCSLVVSVGRISWMGNGVSGKDNCAWYRFGLDKSETIFKGR